ncbi:hypothetical protein EW145_g4540 [Phellinidium pouzarii]|uniref:F-box domain-containing protein n=1 Tax=Phellinidium pouzarii TaxID=167371 RepID=A0A4S4L342_9AGAM|nr:hypothetical protein EW145_g4540 [Phellinidium pouzarii]
MGFDASLSSLDICPEPYIDTSYNDSSKWSSDLHEGVLEHVLMLLPGLLGLHIRNCMKLDHATVFRLLSHTPLLESLSVTTWENPSTLCTSFAGLSSLRNLYIDTRNALLPASVQPLWSNIIAHTKSTHAPLSSLTLRLSEKLIITSAMIDEILDAHADTLTALRFIKCVIDIASVKQICQRCKNLEKLATHVPVKDLVSTASKH